MKTKFTFTAAFATVLIACAAFTANAEGFPPHRFFPAPVRFSGPVVGIRVGIPAPIIPIVPPVAVYGPGYGYAAPVCAPAPVVVAGGFYGRRVFVDRRAGFGGHYGFRR